MTILKPLPNGRGFIAATIIGDVELRPSHQDWRRRTAWWRAYRNGRPLAAWTFTASMALRRGLASRS